MGAALAATLLLLLLSIIAAAEALVARPAVPILGFSTWDCFQGRINETMLQSVADSMVATGLVAAGYSFLNVSSVPTRRAPSP